MAERKSSGTQEKKKEPNSALKALDALLKESDKKRITSEQVMIILDALAGSNDPALVARFPAVLVICARKGLELDRQAVFSRYRKANPKRQNLEKLFFVSARLFDLENLKAPRNLVKITDSFKTRYKDIMSKDVFQLSNGAHISIKDMHATLKSYVADFEYLRLNQDQSEPIRSAHLHRYMDRLFSPKQKDLVLKKLGNESFTKTEREYYSRVVRKKLEAIADEKVREIATILTGKWPKNCNRF